MGLTKYKIGELIQESFCKNKDLEYDISYVRGISNNKQITETKANVDDAVIHKFYIVNPGEFVYNPRTTRMGDKVGLGYNNTNQPLLFSFNNIAFCIRESAKDIILPEYLYMYFNRTEFDRYAMTNGWGSATEPFLFEDMCDMSIELPSLSIQQKYVDVYNAMLENQKNYERGLEDLKLVCDAYVENLRRQMLCESIGPYIEEFNQKNIDNFKLNSVRGIATSKEFINTKANMEGVSLENYKVVEPGMIAFISDTSRRADKMSLALNQSEENYLVSSISTVIQTDNTKLLPKYLYLFFCRTEFDRYARFHSWGSARETFSLDDMKEVRMPLPPIYVQKAIVGIYEAYTIRKEINEKLKAQIKDICPILIKGSLEEGYNE
ncbi:MAG TPA: restriction endonuclease subunit S [Lachnospiraceae bacterium]|nr:restriction endonuclease subunit S [Lachnospiraceae bacterium]